MPHRREPRRNADRAVRDEVRRPVRGLGRCLSTALLVATVAGVTTAVAPRSATPPVTLRLPASVRPASSVASYWLAASDGGVFAFGGLPFYGSMGGDRLNAPVVGIASTTDGRGYRLVASDGGIFTFGDAQFFGSMGGRRLNAPMVGIATDPSTGGYWTVASDGGVFSFGAPFFGSTGGLALNRPIVGMAATPDGRGYWLVASDGGIFSFGDARFFGSTGAMNLNKPIVAMAVTPDGGGYWLVASDGGLFTFGDAPFEGSLGADPLSFAEVGVAGTGVPGETGYWMTNSNGAVSSFGPAGNFGSAPQHLTAPVVGMTDGPGTGAVTDTAYSSGSFGYDVSNFQCGSALPSGHTIGIVQATGWSKSAPNPCVAQEAEWAGGGLNLYVFLTYGTDATDQQGCGGDQACNFGFEAAQYAFDYVQSKGVSPLVTWWLDIECTTNCSDWSSDTAENDQVIAGALIELRGLGINTAGVYTSPLTWNDIVGDYDPPVPMWVAWWTGDPQSNCAGAYSYARSQGDSLPTGGVMITQYTDDQGGFDADYAC